MSSQLHLIDAFIAVVIYLIYRLFGGGRRGPVRYCKTCGPTAKSLTRTRGSFVMEIVLWLLFIIPGVIYSVWRLTTRQQTCRACGSTELVPVDAPAALAARSAQGQ